MQLHWLIWLPCHITYLLIKLEPISCIAKNHIKLTVIIIAASEYFVMSCALLILIILFQERWSSCVNGAHMIGERLLCVFILSCISLFQKILVWINFLLILFTCWYCSSIDEANKMDYFRIVDSSIITKFSW